MNDSTNTQQPTTPSPTNGAVLPTRQQLEAALAAYGSACEDDGWLMGRHGVEGELPSSREAAGEAATRKRYETYRAVQRLLDRMGARYETPEVRALEAETATNASTPEATAAPSLWSAVIALPPCPSWCDAAAGHADHARDNDTVHRAVIDRLLIAPDVARPLEVDVVLCQGESIDWVQRRLEREEPRVHMVAPEDGATVLGSLRREDALDVARALRGAVDVLDGRQRTAQEPRRSVANGEKTPPAARRR